VQVKVDPEECIECGLCINLAPDVYDWDDDGKAKAIEGDVPEEQTEGAQEALESCPTEAIKSI